MANVGSLNQLNNGSGGVVNDLSSGGGKVASTTEKKSSAIKASASSTNMPSIVVDFYNELYSIQTSKGPVSKHKIARLIAEAVRAVRNYKHIVYYVEGFIKYSKPEFKLSGLYVIDAICRSLAVKDKLQTQSLRDLYSKRFGKNICKTVSHLFEKAPPADREKINKVLTLWQKYNIMESEVLDKLNRVVATAKIDSVLNSTNTSTDLNNTIVDPSNKTDANSLVVVPASKSKSRDDARAAKKRKRHNRHSTTSPTDLTTKKEISKILDVVNDSDSDSATGKRSAATNGASSSQTAANPANESNKSSIISNWIQQSNVVLSHPSDQLARFTMPDLRQPPPPVQNKQEREKERSKRGLPPIRDNHVSICSKTIWLGHLSKSTTEDRLARELIDIIAPPAHSSNNNTEYYQEKKKSLIVNLDYIPPRGCAYVEFIDRRTALKFIEKTRADGCRIDYNKVRVDWATNKGINKASSRVKSCWNVEIGCTYIPYDELDRMLANVSASAHDDNIVDFVKWSLGGLVDMDSMTEKFRKIYEQQLQRGGSHTAGLPVVDASNNNSSNDMELDDDEDQNNEPQQPIPQSAMAPQPIAFSVPPGSHQFLGIGVPPPPGHPLQIPASMVQQPGAPNNPGSQQGMTTILVANPNHPNSVGLNPAYQHHFLANPIFSQQHQLAQLTGNPELFNPASQQQQYAELLGLTGNPFAFQSHPPPNLPPAPGHVARSPGAAANAIAMMAAAANNFNGTPPPPPPGTLFAAHFMQKPRPLMNNSFGDNNNTNNVSNANLISGEASDTDYRNFRPQNGRGTPNFNNNNNNSNNKPRFHHNNHSNNSNYSPYQKDYGNRNRFNHSSSSGNNTTNNNETTQESSESKN